MIVTDFKSKALVGNFLNDPVDRPVHIYLPADYDPQGSDRFPVVYYLSGYAGCGASMMNHTPWGETIQQQLDRLITSGICTPLIMVLPDCFTRLGGSQYINSAGTGNYFDYILELVSFIDSTYNTRTEPASRAITGKSSGGFGALYLGMERPDIFGIVADHSGDKYFETCYYPDLLKLPGLLDSLEIESIIRDPYSYPVKDSNFFQLINLAAMSSCYSPNPDSSLGFEWPIDTHTAEIIESTWARWLEYDPLNRLADQHSALKQLKMLYFDCGNRDEYNLHLGSRLLHQRLDDAGIPHLYEEFDGSHRHTRFRLDRHLEIISNAFSD